ncbi:MAG TPA: hypothetical protein PKM57_14445 [Kiritimatiellia bacterium]|nr:hypothetical protein [Kiritimatiellia bacterium]
MPETSPQQRHLLRHWLISAAVFVVFFALYAATAQRGVSWQDSGEFQYRVLAGDYVWHSGIARAHPLYILMARGFVRLFPQSACFYAINLFSGVGLALGLALLSASVMALTRSVRAAVLSAAVLGFAHMAWWLGTVAEVYTWSLAFLMAEILCLVRYFEKREGSWLIALFAVNGAHWSVHNFALIDFAVAFAVLGLEWWKGGRRRGWLAMGCLAGWSLGSLPLLWLANASLMGGESVTAVIKSVLFGEGYMAQVLGTGGCGGTLWLANLALAGVSLINPLWLFAVTGVRTSRDDKRGQPLFWLGILTLFHLLFWVRYPVPDQATFFLPTLGLISVWVGLGGARVGMRPARWALMVTSGCLCAVAGPLLLSVAAQKTGAAVMRSRALPFRSEMPYWLLPWKHSEDSAARFVSEVGRQLCSGDVLVADATAAGPLLAAREAGATGRDWRLLTPWSGETEAVLRTLLQDRKGRVFVVSPVAGYAPRPVLELTNGMERVGALYRLR